MKCCVHCFKDSEIIAVIEATQNIGTCDFCGHEHTAIYEISANTILTELFEGFLDIYSVVDELPPGYPDERKALLRDCLFQDWGIFAVDAECIQKLILALCHDKYVAQPKLFESPVGIAEYCNPTYLEKNAILKTYSWQTFVEDIKRNNRFHTKYVNKDILKLFIHCVRKTYEPRQVFYRARICTSKAGYKTKEMGAPPFERATAGRANPEGVQVLYVSNSEKTTLHEIRAGMFDYVSIGAFALLKQIEVINLAEIDVISPFIANSLFGIDYVQYAVNLEVLRKMRAEIAKPLRRHDSSLDYLPTQYISNFIKSLGFDGIEYTSTMSEEGRNLAVFKESVFRCIKTKVLDIKAIEYEYDVVAKRA